MIFSHFYSQSDVIVGGLEFFRAYSSEFKPILPYLWDSTVVCVKNPDPIPQWKSFFMATTDFRVNVMGFVCVVFATLIIMISNNFEKHAMDYHTVLMYLLAQLINISVPMRKYHFRFGSRFMFSCMAWSMFFVSQLFNGLFMVVLLGPRYPDQIKSVDELQDFEFSTSVYMKARFLARFIVYFNKLICHFHS